MVRCIFHLAVIVFKCLSLNLWIQYSPMWRNSFTFLFIFSFLACWFDFSRKSLMFRVALYISSCGSQCFFAWLFALLRMALCSSSRKPWHQLCGFGGWARHSFEREGSFSHAMVHFLAWNYHLCFLARKTRGISTVFWRTFLGDLSTLWECLNYHALIDQWFYVLLSSSYFVF